MTFQLVHPIGEGSPMMGLSADDPTACDGEFLILLQGFDETFSQTVHAWSSYRAEEVVFGARFADMFDHEASRRGEISVDVGRLHDIERADLGSNSA